MYKILLGTIVLILVLSCLYWFLQKDEHKASVLNQLQKEQRTRQEQVEQLISDTEELVEQARLVLPVDDSTNSTSISDKQTDIKQKIDSVNERLSKIRQRQKDLEARKQARNY